MYLFLYQTFLDMKSSQGSWQLPPVGAPGALDIPGTCCPQPEHAACKPRDGACLYCAVAGTLCCSGFGFICKVTMGMRTAASGLPRGPQNIPSCSKVLMLAACWIAPDAGML